MITIKRVGVVSVGKILGLLYALMGLIVGIIVSSISLIGGAFVEEVSVSSIFGIGAILYFPIMYGIMGFISGVIMAFLYNLTAGWIGGIEVETE